MNKERKEALMRIPLGILAAIIAEFWGAITFILIIINFVIVIFTGKRNKNLTKFNNNYVTFMYQFVRYITFTTNQRPFPFNDLKEIEKVDYKFQN
jgi:amino acid permease